MMTDSITAQQVSARYPTLPPEIRNAIVDPATVETIEKIGMKHGLTKVEAGLLVQSTSLLMMGFIKPTEYVNEIADLTSASRDQIAFIAQEINRDVFNPMKDALKKVHNMGGVSEKSEVPKPAALRISPVPAPEPPKPVEKLNIPFSVANALGNAPAPTPSQPPANIFEKKLSEQFRMKSDTVNVQGASHPKVPHKPTEVVPPPPTQSRPSDPYRESPH